MTSSRKRTIQAIPTTMATTIAMPATEENGGYPSLLVISGGRASAPRSNTTPTMRIHQRICFSCGVVCSIQRLPFCNSSNQKHNVTMPHNQREVYAYVSYLSYLARAHSRLAQLWQHLLAVEADDFLLVRLGRVNQNMRRATLDELLQRLHMRLRIVAHWPVTIGLLQWNIALRALLDA